MTGPNSLKRGSERQCEVLKSKPLSVGIAKSDTCLPMKESLCVLQGGELWACGRLSPVELK